MAITSRSLMCPICEEPVQSRPTNRAFPFCSHRCQLIDLGKWLNEEYCVAGAKTEGYFVDEDS